MKSFLLMTVLFFQSVLAHEKTCRAQKRSVRSIGQSFGQSIGQSFGLFLPINNTSRFTCLTLCQFVSAQILHMPKYVSCNRAFNHKTSQCRLLDLPELKLAIKESAMSEYDSRITVPFETYCQLLCEIHPYCYAAETASIGHRGYHCNLITRSLLKPKPSKVCQKRRCRTFICEKTAHNMLLDFHW
jgi:hypothetical protein